MEDMVDERPPAGEEPPATVEAAEEEAGVETHAFDEGRLAAILESVLFASGEPVEFKRLVEVLDGPSPAEVRSALRAIAARLESAGRGLRLVEVAGGYQLRTARENAEWVRAVFRDKPRKLGRAALETLAVIAYRQPITRADIEAVRGVDVDAVLSTLLQRELVKVVGRKDTVGRPILYGTTDAFLELFGFRDLRELPTLKELPQSAEVSPDEQANPALAPNGSEETAAPGGAAAAPGAPPDGTAPGGAGTVAEAAEPRGDHLAAEGGGSDPGRQGEGERAGGDGAGDEGGSPHRSH